MYTKENLKQQLHSMKLTGKETILIHSSMKAIGEVEGGADTVLDAWMEYFADGLLLLPTHTWANVNAECPLYDYRSTPSCETPDSISQSPLKYVAALHCNVSAYILSFRFRPAGSSQAP